jgi:hypothetical protein
MIAKIFYMKNIISEPSQTGEYITIKNLKKISGLRHLICSNTLIAHKGKSSS